MKYINIFGLSNFFSLKSWYILTLCACLATLISLCVAKFVIISVGVAVLVRLFELSKIFSYEFAFLLVIAIACPPVPDEHSDKDKLEKNFSRVMLFLIWYVMLMATTALTVYQFYDFLGFESILEYGTSLFFRLSVWSGILFFGVIYYIEYRKNKSI